MEGTRTSQKAEANPHGEMPFLDHLEELRRRILICLATAVIGSIVGITLVFKAGVIEILLHPLREAVTSLASQGLPMPTGLQAGGELGYLTLTEPFLVILKFGITVGLLLVSPIIVYQLWAFLSPALEPREKRIIIPSLYFGLALFAGGVTLGYFVALPMSIRFLLAFGAQYHFYAMLTAGAYLSFVGSVLLAFGILFEMPVVITILSGLGLITPSFLRTWRRQAYLGLTVLACVLTPGDLWTTSLLLMGPLVVLYEVSILMSALISPRRRPDIEKPGLAEAAAIVALLRLRARNA